MKYTFITKNSRKKSFLVMYSFDNFIYINIGALQLYRLLYFLRNIYQKSEIYLTSTFMGKPIRNYQLFEKSKQSKRLLYLLLFRSACSSWLLYSQCFGRCTLWPFVTFLRFQSKPLIQSLR